MLAIEKWFLGIHETYERELRGGWGAGEEGETKEGDARGGAVRGNSAKSIQHPEYRMVAGE